MLIQQLQNSTISQYKLLQNNQKSCYTENTIISNITAIFYSIFQLQSQSLFKANIIFNTQMNKALILIIFLLFQACQKQVFIQYSKGQGKILLQYFWDLNDGFYLDIGAGDAIQASKTLNLYVNGWDGINVEESLKVKPDQTNINLAIGDSDSFVKLYEMKDGGVSTVNHLEKQQANNLSSNLKQAPSMSLKSLCERYFYKRPIFMNLNIEGFGSESLKSNDWTKYKCVPQIIICQKNNINQMESTEDILVKQGFIKQKTLASNNLYIHGSVLTKYRLEQQKNRKKLSNLLIIGINDIGPPLAQYLKLQTKFKTSSHYDPQNDQIYFKFTRHGQTIELNHLHQQSKMMNPALPNRPIAILHFHPLLNTLFLKQGLQTMSEVQIGDLWYYEIIVNKGSNQNLKIYVLDHKFENAYGAKLEVDQLVNSQSFIIKRQKNNNTYLTIFLIFLSIVISLQCVNIWTFKKNLKKIMNRMMWKEDSIVSQEAKLQNH